ncbi:MAG: hypothetical protein ACI9R3_000514 [Verrucomicrobiales bacterium]|jgi:hypothetical protein
MKLEAKAPVGILCLVPENMFRTARRTKRLNGSETIQSRFLSQPLLLEITILDGDTIVLKMKLEKRWNSRENRSLSCPGIFS